MGRNDLLENRNVRIRIKNSKIVLACRHMKFLYILELYMLLTKHSKTRNIKKNKQNQPINKLIYIVSLAYPATAIPQLIKVYTTHNVQSLALVTWLLYVTFGLVYLVYAINQRIRPLVIEGALWVGVYVLMVVAIILFK